MPRRRWLLPFLCLMGCVRSDFNLATQREEYTIFSTDKEVAMGRSIAKRVRRELTLLEDESVQQRVQRIGQRLAEVCDRRELVYTFAVVEDKEVNAFSLPGGYVFVNTGLIEEAGGDDALAAVLAHELAHITARHAVKRYEGALGAQLAQLATLATRQGAAIRGVGVAVQSAQLAYARQEELEADRIGARYLKAAGFDPKAMLAMLQKLDAVNREKTHSLPGGMVRPHYAMTHPYIPERLRAVKEALFGVADYLDYLNTPD